MGRWNSVLAIGFRALMLGMSVAAAYGAHKFEADNSKYSSYPQKQIRMAAEDAAGWAAGKSSVDDVLEHLHAAQKYVNEHPRAEGNIAGGSEALDEAISMIPESSAGNGASIVQSMKTSSLGSDTHPVTAGFSLLALVLFSLGTYAGMAGIAELRGKASWIRDYSK